MFLIAFQIQFFISSRVWRSFVSVCLTGFCNWPCDSSKGFVRWNRFLHIPHAFPCQFRPSIRFEQLENLHQCPCPICHNRIRLRRRNFLSVVSTKEIISFHGLRLPVSILGSLAFCSVFWCVRLGSYLPYFLHTSGKVERSPFVAVVLAQELDFLGCFAWSFILHYWSYLLQVQWIDLVSFLPLISSVFLQQRIIDLFLAWGCRLNPSR